MDLFMSYMPIWSFRDQDGKPLVNGKVFFYDNANHSVLKTVYRDAAGLVPYTNPASLDGKGELPPVYFQDDGKYYIEVRAYVPPPLLPTQGDLIWAIPDYPTPQDITPLLTALRYDNLFINGQFNFFNEALIESFVPNVPTEAANFWFFEKNNTSAVDKIQFLRFGLGDIVPESSPTYYFRYQCTSAGVGETSKPFYQSMPSVRSFEQQQLTLSFYARSVSSSILQAVCTQYFGTGGTPSPTTTTPLETFNLTPAWQKYHVTFTVPGLATKVIGTNNDDNVRFGVNLPLDTAATVDITNAYITVGNTAYTYPEENINIEESIVESAFPIGTSLEYCGFNAPKGWFFEDGSQKSRTIYHSLFNALTIQAKGTLKANILTTGDTVFGNSLVQNIPSTAGFQAGWPVSGAAFLPGTLIQSVVNDHEIVLNLNATITATAAPMIIDPGSKVIKDLTTTVNMAPGYQISGPGIPYISTIVSVDSATQITIDKAATVSTTNTALVVAPWGVGDGTTTFNLPNAAGRVVVGAGAGSGLTSRKMGQTGGKEAFTMSLGQLVTHHHGYSTYSGTFNVGSVAGADASITFNDRQSYNTGLSESIDIMNPYMVKNRIIKY